MRPSRSRARKPVTSEFSIADHYHCSLLGPTWPNRFYQHCAQAQLPNNAIQPYDMTTIWDRVAAAGLEGRYYFSDVPFAALLGARHLLVSRTFDQFRSDAAEGLAAFNEKRPPRWNLGDNP